MMPEGSLPRQKQPSTISILRIKLIQTVPLQYVFKISFNIILFSTNMPESLKWFLSLSIPRQNPVRILSVL
jgi:hypothetical protein